MGVRGLTTYLRENRRLLSKPLYFDSTHVAAVTNLVVDAWSFVYELLGCSKLDWVYGGEYEEFSRLVVSVVQSWISVGLKLYFVFDGPCPTLKFDTVISRLTENNVKSSLLFFRTSPSSRSTPRFLNESRIPPPLSFNACLEALKSVAQSSPHSLEIHFAPEEGDPYAVELAGKVNGYVTGYDSDFVILNTDGYQGYIPMDEFVWTSSVDVSDTTSQADEESDFQTVRRRKKERQQTNSSSGIMPAEGISADLVLSCSVYAPSALAAHLAIPPTLLPLLGALVGNDYSSHNHSTQALFFDSKLKVSQRITRVSTVLRTVLSASSGPKRKQKQISSVMDLIRRTVLALFIRDVSNISLGEQESIIDKIVESTLQYAIPKREEHLSDLSGPACLLYGLTGSLSKGLPDNSTVIRELYNDAYSRGCFYPKIVDILHSASFFSRLFLENPDVESVPKTIGRPIREWIYAILDDGVDLPEKIESEPSESPESDENDDDDELIDVVEENSNDEDELVDPLAPLRGALKRLGGDSTPSPPATPSPHPRKPRFVNEYVRRGTRVTPEEVSVPPLPILLSHLPISFSTPVQLSPELTRFRLLLSILSSDSAFESINALPHEHIIPVLAIRSVLNTLYERTIHSPDNKEYPKEKWTKREVKAFLLAFTDASDTHQFSDGEERAPPPEIIDRHVQLTAQILSAIESVIHLAQVLLLDRDLLPLTLVNRFSGRRFHALLNHGAKGARTYTDGFAEERISPELWASVVAGFEEDTFAEDRWKKTKKQRKIDQKEQKQVGNAGKGHRSGMFGLLAEAEA